MASDEKYFPRDGIRFLKRRYRARIVEMKNARKPQRSTPYCNGIAGHDDADGIADYIAELADAARAK